MIQGITADFTELYNLLGTSYSTNSTVKLPDMRGNFSKGYNTGNFGQYEASKYNSGTQETISSISFLYCVKY